MTELSDAKAHRFWNQCIEHVLLCFVVVNTYMLLCVKFFVIGRLLK